MNLTAPEDLKLRIPTGFRLSPLSKAKLYSIRSNRIYSKDSFL